MANKVTSGEFTFARPSSRLLSDNYVASTECSISHNLPNDIFSSVDCAAPTFVHFSVPQVTSHQYHGSSMELYMSEASVSQTGRNCHDVVWTNSQNSVSSSLSSLALFNQKQSNTFNLETSRSCAEKFFCDVQQPVMRCKRKAVDTPGDDFIPTKIRVNEERMSACMNDLHLDNNNFEIQPNFENEMWYSQVVNTDVSATEAVKPNCLGFGSVSDSRVEDNTLGVGLNANSRLELSRELQFGMKATNILPKAILDEVVKSSMQVVLWRPPALFEQPQLLSNTSTTENQMAMPNDNLIDNKDELSKKSHDLKENSQETTELLLCEEWMTVEQDISLPRQQGNDESEMDL